MGYFKRFGAWLWDSLGNLAMIAGWVGAATLLAWATRVAGVMSQYAPFSWVFAGFVGAVLWSGVYVLYGLGKNLRLRAKWASDRMRDGDRIDPMESIFQNKRININDLVNPYNQVVIGKKFINCELIGPANLLIIFKNAKFHGNHFDQSDAVEIGDDAVPQNAIGFFGCDFEGCRFFKVSMLFQQSSRTGADLLIADLHWVTPERKALQIEDKSDGSKRRKRSVRRPAMSDVVG